MISADKKRQADFQIIARWVSEGERVLDLGCGRGVLLEYLKQKKSVFGVGVDIDFDKILKCVERGVTAYQGDAGHILSTLPEGAFDRVIFSRTVEQLEDARHILAEGLRVGRRVTVGFPNKGYWKNRWEMLRRGRRIVNPVYPTPWYASIPSNPFSIGEFEDYCTEHEIFIKNRIYLSGDWQSECKSLPNFFAGYAIYDLAANGAR